MRVDLSSIRKEFVVFEEKREQFIKKARELNTSSKKLIYAVHRGEVKKNAVDDLVKLASELIEVLDKRPKFRQIGALSAALEEYAEAMLFYHYVMDKNIWKKPRKLFSEIYLGALSDFTGELGRRCVFLAIDKKKEDIQKIRDLIDTILAQMMEFDFRNGELRKKSDAIKWNLKKIESILYDLSLK